MGNWNKIHQFNIKGQKHLCIHPNTVDPNCPVYYCGTGRYHVGCAFTVTSIAKQVLHSPVTRFLCAIHPFRTKNCTNRNSNCQCWKQMRTPPGGWCLFQAAWSKRSAGPEKYKQCNRMQQKQIYAIFTNVRSNYQIANPGDTKICKVKNQCRLIFPVNRHYQNKF